MAPPDTQLPAGVEFIEGEKLWLVSRRFLDAQERQALLALYPDAPDKTPVERFVQDLDNRRALEEYMQTWVSEQAVGSRKPYAGDLLAREHVEFPAPMSSALALEVRDGETDRLRAALRGLLALNPDHSFAAALRSLDSQLDPPPPGGPPRFMYAEASVGVEQIEELSDAAVLDKEGKKITWRGTATGEQLETLTRWADLSDFAETFLAVERALRGHTLKFEFDATQPFPTPEQIPPALRERLRVVTEVVDPETPHILWVGLHITPREESALRLLEDQQSGHGASFREAVGKLLLALGGKPDVEVPVVEVPVQETGWRPRPGPDSLGDEGLKRLLGERLLVGNGRLRFYGWMTRDEGERLLEKAAGEPDRAAVARLFADSLVKGMDGGSLRVTARRGSAGVKSVEPVSSLRKGAS